MYLDVKAGDLVIWDSRTFHQNTCGDSNCNEERLIQYLCYLPKNSEKNTLNEQKQRRNFLKKIQQVIGYPMNVVPKQPNMYNYYNPDWQITINYDELPKPQIDDLIEKIEKLL